MKTLALLQGLYLLISGAWGVLHIESFQRVTGRKTDLWLVKTVGLLLVAVGIALLVAAAREQFDPALIVVAIGSAAALLIIELVYVPKRVIPPIYWLDGAIEAGFIVAWTACLLG